MFKSIFLSELFIWIRLFIDGGSMGFIDFVDWLGFRI